MQEVRQLSIAGAPPRSIMAALRGENFIEGPPIMSRDILTHAFVYVVKNWREKLAGKTLI